MTTPEQARPFAVGDWVRLASGTKPWRVAKIDPPHVLLMSGRGSTAQVAITSVVRCAPPATARLTEERKSEILETWLDVQDPTVDVSPTQAREWLIRDVIDLFAELDAAKAELEAMSQRAEAAGSYRDLLAEFDAERMRAVAAERERDAHCSRAEAAEAKFAALREAAESLLAAVDAWERLSDLGALARVGDAERRARAALADVDAAAASYRTRVEAKVLERAADALEARGKTTRHHTALGECLTESGSAWCDAARTLRDEAAKRKAGVKP